MSNNEFIGTPLTRYLFGAENARAISTRTIDGQSWYMSADICGRVGIRNHGQAVHRERKRDEFTLKSSEWRNESNHIGNYGKQKVLMVNNGGMLKLIYQSKTPAALEVQAKISDIPKDLFPAEWNEYLSELDD